MWHIRRTLTEKYIANCFIHKEESVRICLSFLVLLVKDLESENRYYHGRYYVFVALSFLILSPSCVYVCHLSYAVFRSLNSFNYSPFVIVPLLLISFHNWKTPKFVLFIGEWGECCWFLGQGVDIVLGGGISVMVRSRKDGWLAENVCDKFETEAGRFTAPRRKETEISFTPLFVY